MTRVIVFNGWAAGPEAWELTTFPRDWTLSYIEALDGVQEKVLADFDEVVLVGFSMGGAMALRAYLDHPEKVKGLVLVSATPCMLEHKDQGWAGMSERRFRAFAAGVELVFGDDPAPWYAPDQMARGLDFLVSTDLRAELEARAAADRAAGVKPIPVRLFHSEKDGVVRPQNAAYLKGIFPQAEVTIVPGTEHALPVTIPERIDRAVAEVLTQVDAPSVT